MSYSGKSKSLSKSSATSAEDCMRLSNEATGTCNIGSIKLNVSQFHGGQRQRSGDVQFYLIIDYFSVLIGNALLRSSTEMRDPHLSPCHSDAYSVKKMQRIKDLRDHD